MFFSQAAWLVLVGIPIVQVLFLVGKFTFVTWSWWWIMSPTIGFAVIMAALIVVMFATYQGPQ